jgi:pimeloyl-ACP methyl ester carboxylesterase
MQSSKNGWSLQLRKILVFLFIFTISSCSTKCEKKPIKKRGGKAEDKAVVLFHGLNDENGLKGLQQDLAGDLKDIKVVDLNRANSGSVSIVQQAKEAFDELKKQGLTDKELVLVGQSQGGLVAWEVYNSFKKELKVKGLITNQSPWGGAPVGKNFKDPAKVKTLLQEAKNALHNAAPVIGPLVKKMMGFNVPQVTIQGFLPEDAAIETNINNLLAIGARGGQGLADILPGSAYLTQLKSDVVKADIPILMLSGEVKNFAKCILPMLAPDLKGFLKLDQLSPQDLQSLNFFLKEVEKAWRNIVGDPANDLFIPLDSQEAKGINNANIGRARFNDYSHFTGMGKEVQPIYDEILKTIKKDLNIN